MGRWNGDARAVVPPQYFKSSRDVQAATGEASRASPCPLGLGVYAIPSPGSGKPKRALQMLYVSERVARDRAPEADYRNGACVKAGWYVIGNPGVNFEVLVSRINDLLLGEEREDGYVSLLTIDGERTHDEYFFAVPSPTGMDCSKFYSINEAVYRGFLERQLGGFMPFFERKYRMFAFRKAHAGGDLAQNGTNEGVGTIRLDTGIGQMKFYNNGNLTSSATYKLDGKGVSEKAMAKEGTSLGVRRDGKVLKTRERWPAVFCSNTRVLPEAAIVLHVRERSWMRSRRLIDDDGSPCTYDMYKDLLERDNAPQPPQGTSPASTPKKKVKVELLADDADTNAAPILPGEVIDLT